MTMAATPDHVTFRPGDLLPQLTRGGRPMGSNAKRDLARHYALVVEIHHRWMNGWTMYDEAWDVIVAYVATRDWVLPPEPEELDADFKRFLASPMGQIHDRTARSTAATALLNASWAELFGIIHHAEGGLAARTADATSEVSSGR